MKVKTEEIEIPEKMPIYNVNFELTNLPYLCVSCRGDQHIGVSGLNIPEMIYANKSLNDDYKNHILNIETGDLIENGLKSSIGHNYDLEISDPDTQLTIGKDYLNKTCNIVYGNNYKTIPEVTRKNTKHTRVVYVLGNHEYRSRKESGQWLNKSICNVKGVLDGGVGCILKINLSNKKLGLKRTYRIYVTHRLTGSAKSTSNATLEKSFIEKLNDFEDIDAIVCGHYHKQFKRDKIRYMANGTKKRILFACNPSPIEKSEYATWNKYSPTNVDYFTNIFLPLDKNKAPYFEDL